MRSLVFHTLEKEDAWSIHLQDIFQSLEIPSGTLVDNVSASVALYCRQYHPQGVQRSDLVLLIARAFCAVNDRGAAERVLKSLQPHGRHVSRWLEILSELHQFPSLLPYFSAGVIRPADWAGAEQDRMWILDFTRMAVAETERHEMMIYRSIRVLLESIYIFWDVSSGEGVLGLKGLLSLNMEKKYKNGQTLTLADDLLDYIGTLFTQQKDIRKWSAIPSLLNLDL